MSIRTLIKFSTLKLHEHNWLKQSEVDCRCSRASCTQTLLDEGTFSSYIETRREFGGPITITNWFRCQTHNKEVGGSNTSKHKLGLACDLTPNNGEIDTLAIVARKFFHYVKLYKDKNFIHCHNNPDTDWDWYTGSETEKLEEDAYLEYGAAIGGAL